MSYAMHFAGSHRKTFVCQGRSQADRLSFVAVGTSYERSSEAPPLPDGWSIEKRVLTEGLTVSLKGEVIVLRLQNGGSFQGPISGQGCSMLSTLFSRRFT